LGNIMARVRMILLYDLAKKRQALVCGTENKSEHLLGYFTRYGDEASDFEPIKHLYKTQVYQLAKALGVPNEIIQSPPSAGLWLGQTDEKQFGFSYYQADQILFLYLEKGLSLPVIVKKTGVEKRIVEKVISWYKTNDFKHRIPYSL
jgi:NAD+ synthase